MKLSNRLSKLEKTAIPDTNISIVIYESGEFEKRRATHYAKHPHLRDTAVIFIPDDHRNS